MRKLILVLATVGLFCNGFAFEDGPKRGKKKSPEKYCAQLKDGVIKVLHDGQELTADVKLDNGTVIRTDATVVKTDGTVIMLKEGECVDLSGKVEEQPAKLKSKKQ